MDTISASFYTVYFNEASIVQFIDLPVEITMFVVKVHGAFGVTNNRRGLLWPDSECQNKETAQRDVLLITKILSSVVHNPFQSIFTNSPITERETEM